MDAVSEGKTSMKGLQKTLPPEETAIKQNCVVQMKAIFICFYFIN